jgi:hypothetical protein
MPTTCIEVDIMSRQLSLFDPPATAASPPPPRDPHVQRGDERRLSGQNATILHLLRQGSCTNVELARVSLKYTSRISDLRAAGHRIVCRRGDGGCNVYTLEE